jgi:hypothetical protein
MGLLVFGGNMKCYGIWYQPKDGDFNGRWLYCVNIGDPWKTFDEVRAHEMLSQMPRHLYSEVREYHQP